MHSTQEEKALSLVPQSGMAFLLPRWQMSTGEAEPLLADLDNPLLVGMCLGVPELRGYLSFLPSAVQQLLCLVDPPMVCSSSFQF